MSPSPAFVSSLAVTGGVISSTRSSPFQSGRSSFVPSAHHVRNQRRAQIFKRADSHGDVKMVFGLGVPELGVIAGIALLIWGPKKLEGMGKELGSLAGSVKKATSEFTDAMETSLKEADQEIEKAKEERLQSKEDMENTPVATEVVQEKEQENTVKAAASAADKKV